MLKIHVQVQASSFSRRPPPVIGSGDWNTSGTSLRLVVGLQHESVMENSPLPLPLMQGVSERKTRVSYSGRRPSLSGANTQAAAAERTRTRTPMTPSKIVKRKSLGFVRWFVRLGFRGGDAHATEGKYPGLGLGLGRHAADSDDEEEDYGNQQQRTRRKSFLKLLLYRDKSKDRKTTIHLSRRARVDS